MDDLVSRKELLAKFDQIRQGFEKYPLMYGGDLEGIETFDHMLSAAESIVSGRDQYEFGPRAYGQIRDKYRCGPLGLSSQTADYAKKKNLDMGQASLLLIERLREIRELEAQWIADLERYHFNVVGSLGSDNQEEWIGLCKEFPSLSWVAPSKEQALIGIKKVVAGLIFDMRENKEEVPKPIT